MRDLILTRRLSVLGVATLAFTAAPAIAATTVKDGNYRGTTTYHDDHGDSFAGLGVQRGRIPGVRVFNKRTCRNSRGHVIRNRSGSGYQTVGFQKPVAIKADGRFDATGRYTNHGRRTPHGKFKLLFKGRFVSDEAKGVFGLRFVNGSGKHRVKCVEKRVKFDVRLVEG